MRWDGNNWYTVRTVSQGVLRDLEFYSELYDFYGDAACIAHITVFGELHFAQPLARTCVRWSRGMRLAIGFDVLR